MLSTLSGRDRLDVLSTSNPSGKDRLDVQSGGRISLDSRQLGRKRV